MPEYIEREKVYKALNNVINDFGDSDYSYMERAIAESSLDYAREKINGIPAADIRPERHGEWVWGRFDGKGYPVWCSECGVRFIGNSGPAKWLKCPEHQYCGNCGAKMDGKVGKQNNEQHKN